jgi:hypothetical protein
VLQFATSQFALVVRLRMTRASWKALQKQRFKVCLQRFFRFGIRTGTMSKSLPDATEVRLSIKKLYFIAKNLKF